jgi:transposase InsO family protein
MASPRYPNLAAELVPTRINQLWVADLTYVRLRSTFVFLAVLFDAFSRYCVGWSPMTQPRAELVIDALKMALRRRQRRWAWSTTPIRASSTRAPSTSRCCRDMAFDRA